MAIKMASAIFGSIAFKTFQFLQILLTIFLSNLFFPRIGVVHHNYSPTVFHNVPHFATFIASYFICLGTAILN